MAKRKARNTLGFGFDPAQSPHHFAVIVERESGAVTIEERFTFAAGEAGDGDADAEEATPEASAKATLDAYHWARVASTVAEAFNARLRAADLPTGTWAAESLLAPHLGKELTLLFWAVEDADPSLLPAMLANWVGLAPEERWWLYTTINATSGHPEHGRDRGWRKAIKIAFAENPIAAAAPSALLGDAVAPRPRRPTQRRAKHPLPTVELDQPTLF
ncbi:MAG TPA: DUF3780 domain-containing protein [Ktedonobacterales bacterium]|jgi:hypothetical protein|nr:DUF3780 domain-containing protein [Ktedonobacterales bacterium]